MSDPRSQTPEGPSPDAQWHDAGPADLAPPGTAVEVVVGDRIVAIANVEGRLHALDGICSHQGGPLGKGKLAGCTLTCPWHGWQYDVSSGRQKLSETIRQASFAVRVQSDRIWVCLDPQA